MDKQISICPCTQSFFPETPCARAAASSSEAGLEGLSQQLDMTPQELSFGKTSNRCRMGAEGFRIGGPIRYALDFFLGSSRGPLPDSSVFGWGHDSPSQSPHIGTWTLRAGEILQNCRSSDAKASKAGRRKELADSSPSRDDVADRLVKRSGVEVSPPTVDSEQLEHECRMIYAGVLFSLVWGRRTTMFQLSVFYCSAITGWGQRY